MSDDTTGKNPTGPQPPQIHSKRAATAYGHVGPFAEQPHELDNPTARRARALQLAIETVRSVRDFSNYQVVHTASLFDQFLENGATPPVRQSPEDEVADDADL